MWHRKTHKTIRGKRERGEQPVTFISIASPQDPENHQKEERERERGEQLVIFISIVGPQDLQNHQQEQRERRKVGDIYKNCGTARPTKPSEGREREEKTW